MAILDLSLNAHGNGAGRMHIFDNNTSINRDAVVNQLCAVVVPILFICVGLLFIWGERLANQLLRKDTYDQKGFRSGHTESYELPLRHFS
jgi:hypothetical protein